MFKIARISWLLTLGWGVFGSLYAATFSVSKDGRGAYSSIQAAVDAAGKGDIVEILDAATYEEQVTIDSSKSGLTLRSSNPTSLKKPTIKFQDDKNVGPKTCQEALDDEKINFDKNGALQIISARNITVDGIGVDGVNPFAFAYQGIWGNGLNCSGQLHPLFHGNGGISIHVSGAVTIRNCDIKNAYFGINVKDRNQGGIFGNANPADLEKWRVVPLSGFGKTGNHLIEHNRIHHNSWGMFFESKWDQGTNIRYNLFFKNHHHTDAFAQSVKSKPDGDHQPGGAILFKDVMLTPIAIHNNTFWHNYLVLAGGWRAGSQHLLFNNLIAEPNQYWNSGVYSNPFHPLDPAFATRTWHSIYAAQTEPVKVQETIVQHGEMDHDATPQKYVEVKETVPNYQPRIMNGMGDVERGDIEWHLTIPLTAGDKVVTKTVNSVTSPGNRIVATEGKAFPATANVRWLETVFKSTDPASPEFLTPDWDNQFVKDFVVDGGWPDAGILDADGSIADIGAISSGGVPRNNVTVKALSPVVLNGTKANVQFDISGDITNPKIAYVRFIRNVAFQGDAFGGNSKPIPASEIVKVTVPSVSLQPGGNNLVFDVPSRTEVELYAFFELIVEGTNSKGKKVSSAVGFLPYRKLEYKFEVLVVDLADKPITEVKAGDPVRLVIKPLKADGASFPNTVKPVEVNLTSGSDLLVPTEPPTKLGFPEGITGGAKKPVIFTKVPKGGVEYVNASGIWEDAGGGQSLAFYGTSDGITILPGDPEKVVFQTPPSKIQNPGAFITVDPGFSDSVHLAVFDKYDNRVNSPVAVNIKSNSAAIGDIDGAKTKNSTDSGSVAFAVKVTNGKKGERFELEASISGKPADKADILVGEPRDKLWVFYGDKGAYDEGAELRGTAGIRVPVTLWVSKDGKTKSGVDMDVSVSFSSSLLKAYASETADTPVGGFGLAAGELVIWVTSTGEVSNAAITVEGDNTVLSGNRESIFFEKQDASIKEATFFADNGLGKVDRLEIYYQEALKMAPDSVLLFWPSQGSNSKVIQGSRILLDATDKTHVTVSLTGSEFPEGITTYVGGNSLGSSFHFDPAAPDLGIEKVGPFAIKDGVGPLITKAVLLERVTDGNDILWVTFSEKVDAATVKGKSLKLIKSGDAVVELDVTERESDAAGTTLKLTVKNAGANAPKAGEKLSILSNGGLVDMFGNLAHEENRPVEIELKAIPAGIVSGYYADRTAPYGNVDLAEITFNKAVDIDDLLLAFEWGDGNTATVGKDRLSLADTDEKILNVDLSGAFTESVQGITSGEMKVRPSYISAPEDTLAFSSLADSVAPVILEATIRLSETAGAGNDTLDLVFSEHVEQASWTDGAIQVRKQRGGELLLINTEERSGNGREWRVIFADSPENEGFGNILPKDSVRIVQGTLSDATGNAPGPQTLLAEVLGKPRPPVMVPEVDRSVIEVSHEVNGTAFVIAGTDGSEWLPVLGERNGTSLPCDAGAQCGGPVAVDPNGKATGFPSITITFDRPFDFNFHVFSNLGAFVNSFQGSITAEQLGMDSNVPLAKSMSTFGTSAGILAKHPVTGKYQLKLVWKAMTKEDGAAATGAYLLRLVTFADSFDEKGNQVKVKGELTQMIGVARKR